jgi:hypothetical protein
MPVYWLVSLPLLRGRRDTTWELLQEKTSYGQQLSSNAKLEMPELRVGTMDVLLQHSDDLAKTSMGTDAIVAKLRRTIHDVAGPAAVASLKVENLPVESYLTRFRCAVGGRAGRAAACAGRQAHLVRRCVCTDSPGCSAGALCAMLGGARPATHTPPRAALP